MAAFDTDYLIIGSGFGGSVSALRLAQKGYRVLVVEQGRRFAPRDMPESTRNLRRFLWLPSLFCRGFFSLRLFRHMLVLHGNAVGGGSVVYANTLLVPPEKVWRSGTWALLRDWAAEMPGHYRTAEKMLGVTTNPLLADADYMLKKLADEAGVGGSFYRTRVAVYFGADDEHAQPQQQGDPYFAGKGPARAPCIGCGGCMVGCRHRAKNSLDYNYLYLAEKLGAKVLAESRVSRIEPLDKQDKGHTGWRVTVKPFKQPEQHFTAQNVIVSAGSLGTQALLFDMKEKGVLPELSPALGRNVFTNAESLIGVRFPGGSADFSRGIAIGSGIHLADGTHIEATRFPAGSNIASLLGTLMNHSRAGRMNLRQWLGAFARGWLTRPRQMWQALRPKNMARESLIFLCMQTAPQPLNMVWRRPWFWPWRRRLASEGARIPAYIPAAGEFAFQAAQAHGGSAFSCVADVFLNIPATAHCMGGAALAASPEEGVCDAQHRVFGYQNLYVIDGANISANLGVNPSLTITALAEAAISHIPPKECL